LTRRRIGQRVRSLTRATRPREAKIPAPDTPLHKPARLAYSFVIEDELSECHAAAFAGMKIERDDRTTIISGPVRDQAELQGLLSLIGALHLTLLSVEPVV